MVKKRLLLPYGVAGDTVIPLTLDELKWILRDVNVDAIDVSRYPNPKRAAETIYRITNGEKKIYSDLKNSTYRILPDIEYICSRNIAEYLKLDNYAETANSILAPTATSSVSPSSGSTNHMDIL